MSSADKDPWVVAGYDTPITPDQVEMWLRYCTAESSLAESAVKRANDHVVICEENLTVKVAEVTLAEDTPPISRTFTVAHLKAYVDRATATERLVLELAKAELAAAKSRLHILGRISSNCQSLNTNLRGERGTPWDSSRPSKYQGSRPSR